MPMPYIFHAFFYWVSFIEVPPCLCWRTQASFAALAARDQAAKRGQAKRWSWDHSDHSPGGKMNPIPHSPGVGKYPFLGMLGITFKYLLEIIPMISPRLEWCAKFMDIYQPLFNTPLYGARYVGILY